ncbi:Hypothetical protein R9X50_00126500 [Acrodontium crateriforme]|uniref:Carrier domain-containing protein n=1 Tax=Acrodontium crateriforme TaxID=150365 RepID=A0AAQ3M0G6_9PEZI|nr:Hypothetical protein R9X50_00126500 [Acrodontium crateriforme]
MSFGFSAGDFLAAITLVYDVVSALRGQATFEYRELVLELEGLQHALREIEHLPTNAENECAVNAVKVAALMCRYPLVEFQDKLKKYDLLQSQGSQVRKRDLIVGTGRKVQWNLSMPDEVVKLRAYLAAHVGSLNMRLLALGFNTAALTTAKQRQTLDDIEVAVSEIKVNAEANTIVLAESRAGIGGIRNILMTTVAPQLQGLLDMVNKIWVTNTQVMNILTVMSTQPPAVDTKHTWFQEPIRFEDAFGRIIPVPSEYGWSKMEAIILDQFSCGPGHDKVFAGEYELFDSKDSSKIIAGSNSIFAPGMSITMAVVIGRYEKADTTSCPKPGCRSKIFQPSEAGGQICGQCQTWFGPSRKPIPRPFRLLCTEKVEKGFDSWELKCAPTKTSRSGELSREVFRNMRNERKWFKNMRIHRTELADVPGLFVSTDKACPIAENITVSAVNEDQEPAVDDLWLKVKKLIAKETDVDENELYDDTRWEDLGIDSLLSLSILGTMREHLSMQLDVYLFQQCPTVSHLRHFIRTGMKDETNDASSSPGRFNATLKKPEIEHPKARSVVLRGRPGRAKKIIWIFPDETGSPVQYVNIGDLGDGIALIGLQSPYIMQGILDKNHAPKFGLVDLALSCLIEIRQKQIEGPYIFAGWSAGAIVAFEACSRLVFDDQVVSDLVLMDSLFPEYWKKPVAQSLYTRFDSAGLMTPNGRPIARNLRLHVDTVVDAIYAYEPIPVISNDVRVSILNANESVKVQNNGIEEEWAEEILQHPWTAFLMQRGDDRATDSRGWDEAMYGGTMDVAGIPGDHFTMLKAPNVEHLTTCLRRIVA